MGWERIQRDRDRGKFSSSGGFKKLPKVVKKNASRTQKQRLVGPKAATEAEMDFYADSPSMAPR